MMAGLVVCRAAHHNLQLHDSGEHMSTLRQLFMGSVLILTLALSAFAGEISTPLAPPQPAPTPAAEGDMSTTFNGTIHTGDTDETTAGDAVVAGAVSVLQSVLALL
jgi:hypothetical protein